MLASLAAAMIAAGSLAPQLAAATLDAPHAAVLRVISHTNDSASCSPAELMKAAADASIRALGRIGNDDVVLAEVAAPCMCGAQDCPYYAIRLSRGNPRVLMSTYAIAVRTTTALPLPRLIAGAHDNVAVIGETTYAYRGDRYVTVDSSRVRVTDSARKPDAVPVQFAAGASSTALHGSVSTGWYDMYSFGASKGQSVLVDGVRSRAKTTFSLVGPNEHVTALRAGVPFTLPASGTYQLMIDSDSENDVPYALTLAIR
jgi:hypothetical protein